MNVTIYQIVTAYALCMQFCLMKTTEVAAGMVILVQCVAVVCFNRDFLASILGRD